MATSRTGAAVRAVFYTAELAEIILTYLPFFDLVRVQRVSHRFRDLVRASTALRRKLLLLPARETQRWRLLNPNGSINAVSFAPVLKELRTDEQLYTPTRMNPLLRQSTAFSNFGAQSSAKRARTCGGEILCPERSFLEAIKSWIRSGQVASWQSMFLTNPPCAHAKFHAYWRTGKMHCLTIADVSNIQGVRMGNLIQRSLEETGEVYVRNESGVYCDRRPGKSMLDYVAGDGDNISVELGGASHIWVPGVVCPSEDERRTVEVL